MARFLANSAACHLFGPGRHFQSETCSSRAPVSRIHTFSSGFRASSGLDLTARPGQDLFFKANLSISSRKGKASRCVTRAMFERFTDKADKVIMLSQEEARMLGHNFVGTEQILLGLIRERTGIAAKVLKSIGITLEDTREEVEKIIGRGSGSMPGEIPFTPRAKCVLDLSLKEARKLGRYDVGPEHLLLALLRKEGGEGVAARVLENLGAYQSDIWKQVIRMVWENNEDASRSVYRGISENIKTPTPEEKEDETKVKKQR